MLHFCYQAWSPDFETDSTGNGLASDWVLAGHNLIYFGPEPWEGLWRNRHWLMSRFALENRVLYVEPQLALRRTWREWHAGQLQLAPWSWQPLTHIQDGLYVYHHPPFAPITGLPVLRSVTWALRARLLQRAARRLRLRRPIVWIARPDVAELAVVLAPRLMIYHVVDEYSAYPGMDPAQRARVQAAEQPLLRHANLVLVTSQRLLEAKRVANPRTFLVPNAVNAQAYDLHRAQGTPEPPELAAVPRPRLGYIGLVGPKLDLTLLEQVARARPDWSLIFVGALPRQAPAQWARLAALANVHYLGAVPPARVPEFVCAFDVGLMPYASSAHAQYIDPLKLYDYLAAGKPVVSADLPALDGFRQVVRVAGEPAEFVQAVERALQGEMAATAAERRRLAATHTWEARAETITNLIQAALLETDAGCVAPRRSMREGESARRRAWLGEDYDGAAKH